jgi:RND family efflux transporter MFP subunit
MFLLVLLACDGASPIPMLADQAAVATSAPVEVVQVSSQALAGHVDASGVLEALSQATVVSEGGGRVTRIHVQPGDRVRSGDVLVSLESGRQSTGVQAARATLDKATAVRDNAQLEYDRGVTLGDALSDAQLRGLELQLAVAQADADAAKANLASAQRQLADTRIRAPFDGVVGRTLVDVGGMIGQGTPAATVSDHDTVRVRLGVPWEQAQSLVPGAGATVHTPLGDVSGQVHSVSPELDRATGTVFIEVRATNSVGALPNSPVTLTLEQSAGETGLVLPVDAVLERFGESVVFVVDQGTARQSRVTVLPLSDDRVHVLSGLSEGDAVVVVGGERLNDGDPVQVVGEDGA